MKENIVFWGTEEENTKAQQRSLHEPVCVSIFFFLSDTPDLSVTVVPLEKLSFASVKTRKGSFC